MMDINYGMSTQICPELHKSGLLLAQDGASEYAQRQSLDLSESDDASSIDACAKDGFQDRRRRAAKLSQFFGVNPFDIAPSSTLITRQYSMSPKHDDNATSELIEVEVQMSGRRFWSFSDKPNRREVLDQLRGLRAT